MPYQYLDEITSADLAFEATGTTVEEMFCSAADAVMNAMVLDLAAVAPVEVREVQLKCTSTQDLLYEFLQKFVYYKDAEGLFLRVADLRVSGGELKAKLQGESISPAKHELGTDVKGVTLHHFEMQKTATGWRARVVLDI